MGAVFSLFQRPRPPASPDATAASAFSLLPSLIQGTIISVLKELYSAVSPDLPSDLTSTPVPTNLPNNPPALHFNYDEAHAGRFTVPHTDGASLPFDWVLAQPDPRDYIMANLAYYSPSCTYHSDSTELVIMSPGLNTVHQPRPGELPSTARMIHYTNILMSYPMAQIHTGSSRDQPAVVVDASKAPLLRALAPRLPERARPTVLDGGALKWEPDVLDAMQVALSAVGHWEPPVKVSMGGMLETSRKEGASPFVLVVYSRASVECDSALRKHVKESLERGEEREEVERRLRERVTVVTVGSASNGFVDGPRYLHLAAWNDGLSAGMGVNAKNNVDGAGREAVFLNCDTPWNAEAFDNHNFSSSTSQYLSVVMAASGATGYADLWDKARRGEMVVPEGVNEIVNAMIVVTKGAEYLWDPEAAWKGVDRSVFPDRTQALRLLREKMGEQFAERLLKSFPDE
eukprot:GFKZ01000604.1.p1 GENE.GFKZ01000604.1~~GFKZ01000604.1.p1  ORF type:complete len:459 (+),score=70.60 GFKZ01000604.1:445-1821(+)